MKVGSIVVGKLGTGVNSRNEPGVCYEVYSLCGQTGYGILFEGGGYDGFSPEDVAKFLAVSNEIEESVRDYVFSNVVTLNRDYRAGRFAEAFKTGRWWSQTRDKNNNNRLDDILYI